MARKQSKDQHEKHQAILSRMLKDDDNKYCVDCDAKGPRWASWNLGIFLCIRCAGIHRNLGVHISKVKSINLDSWTPEQIASMEDMGNSRARAVYEANLPDNYKRPSSSDSAMEQFIRAKYEHKKYIAREWVPPKPRSAPTNYYDTDKETKKETKRQTKTVLTIPGAASGTNAATAKTKSERVTAVKQEVKSSSEANQPSLMVDLNSPAKQANGSNTNPSTSSDLLADIFSSPAPAQPSSAGSNDLLGLSSASPSQSNNTQQQSSGDSAHDLFKAADEKSQSTKDSIMALFGNSAPQQQHQSNMMQNSLTMQGSYTHNQPHTQVQQQQQQPLNTAAGNMMYSQMMQPGMMNNYQMPQPQPQPQPQPNMIPTPQGYYQQGMMGNHQQGMMGNPQQGMMGNLQQGMMGNPQQGMMGNLQQGMMGNHQQGMMGNAHQGIMGLPQQGFYNQQQMFAAQQLQAQMANMSVNQQQQTIPQKVTMATAGGANASWGNSSSQTNGQTLNFDLWN